MMSKKYAGVWPTMITPFTDNDKPDFAAMQKMVEWYIAKGCDGIFAVCQSSEMFYLSPGEKIDIATCVRDAAAGRVKVIASGHTADRLDDQKREIAAMAALGLDAVVLVSNRLAGEKDGEAVFNKNLESIFASFPDVPFGLYECPYPYKRLVTLEFLRNYGSRMSFIKDTCCDSALLVKRVEAAGGTGVALFNANTSTLLQSLREGYDGYNGVMANFHPELYCWLYRNHRAKPEKGDEVSDLLTVLAMSEARCYPVTAKYHFARCGVPMSLHTRAMDAAQLNENDRLGIESMIRLEKKCCDSLP